MHCRIQFKVLTTLPLLFKGLWEKIENLKQQMGKDINDVTFGKFVTSLVQKLKILEVYKNCNSRYWLQISFFSKYVKFLDQQRHKFFKGDTVNVFPDL